MTIKLLTCYDHPRVSKLWLSTPGMGLNTADDGEEGFARYLRRNPNTCFIAEEEEALVGVILAGHDGRRGYLYHLAVLPAYRNRGIGRALVDAAMSALEKEGIHKTALVVFSKNAAGNAFWEKIGFTAREDLVYRNKNIHSMERIDT